MTGVRFRSVTSSKSLPYANANTSLVICSSYLFHFFQSLPFYQNTHKVRGNAMKTRHWYQCVSVDSSKSARLICFTCVRFWTLCSPRFSRVLVNMRGVDRWNVWANQPIFYQSRGILRNGGFQMTSRHFGILNRMNDDVQEQSRKVSFEWILQKTELYDSHRKFRAYHLLSQHLV